jgi:Zn-dependent metalloprotease
VVFGTGFVVDDVVAHEWMHGYIDYGSGYLYEYQSGALNEAVADMFGEAVDILNQQFISEPDQVGTCAIQRAS